MSKLKKTDLSIAEEKEDFLDTVIERKNLTNQFTVGSIVRHLKQLNKLKTEIDGTVSLAEKMIDNIKKNHQELIDKVSDEERSHLWLYQENANIINEGSPKQKEVDEEISKHEEYLDTICEKFGWERPNTTVSVAVTYTPKDEGSNEEN